MRKRIEDRESGVALVQLSAENREQVVSLKVAEDQEDFVDSNLYVIAESRFRAQLVPYGITRDDAYVGMVSVGDNGHAPHVIHHLMGDAAHQGQGVGAVAMRLAIRLMAEDADADEILLSYWPGNPAVSLYERPGFRHTGEKTGRRTSDTTGYRNLAGVMRESRCPMGASSRNAMDSLTMCRHYVYSAGGETTECVRR